MSTVLQSINPTSDQALNDQQNDSKTSSETSQLNSAVKQSIRRYLYELDGETPNQIYDMVLQQVEKPLLETVLEYTHGNQSKAAEYLGLNRGTLRKKLRAYGLDK